MYMDHHKNRCKRLPGGKSQGIPDPIKSHLNTILVGEITHPPAPAMIIINLLVNDIIFPIQTAISSKPHFQAPVAPFTDKNQHE